MLEAAICGMGRWGRRLLESVTGSERIRFVALVTRDASKAPDGKGGLEVFTRIEQALASPRVAAVVLATPHSQHFSQIVAAARAGKHVFVEKPFTLTRAQAETAIDECRRAGVTLSVGFNRRHAPAFVEMRRRIAEGAIGELQHLEGHHCGPSGLQLEPGQWRAERSESPGGAMTPRGVHALDCLLQLGGPVQQVFAHSQRRQLAVDVDDTTALLLRFRSGLTGYLATLHATGEYWRVQAFGSRGWLEMRSDVELVQRGLEGPPQTTVLGAVDKERAELEAFADAVAARQGFVVAPADILAGVAVTEALVASAASGRPLVLD